MHSEWVQLKDIASVKAGHPIRGAVTSDTNGDVAVVQIKNVQAETGIDWPVVTRTILEGRRAPDWLEAGDILFSARGHRNIAVCVNEPPLKAVCSPHFFLIRIRNEKQALPEFVAWQMNLPQSQTYFAQSATGSFITSIRRQVLEKTRLLLPSIEKQRLLVRFSQAAQHEKELMKRLMENRRQELNIVATKLLT